MTAISLEENQQTRNLDGQYTVFGRVISGMDVVDKIAALQTTTVGQTPQPANIEEARILSIKIAER